MSSLCSVQSEFSSPRNISVHTYYLIARLHLSCKSKSFCKLGCAVIYFIKPQTHGKSQHSEIFVNKAAEPRRKRAMPVGYCEKPASCVAAKSVVLLAQVIYSFARISQIRKPTLSFRPSEARGEISVINIDLNVPLLPTPKKYCNDSIFQEISRLRAASPFTPFGSHRAPLEMTFPAPTIFNNFSRKQNHISAPAHSICRYLGSRKG